MAKMWRNDALAVIGQIRQEHPQATADELKALLHAAYPFGERKRYPYRVWCECVREALGKARHQVYVKPLSELPLFEETKIL